MERGRVGGRVFGFLRGHPELVFTSMKLTGARVLLGLAIGLLTAAGHAEGQPKPAASPPEPPALDSSAPFVQPIPLSQMPQANAAGATSPTEPAVSLPPGVQPLTFDAETKEYDAKPNDAFAEFSFTVTNVWTNDVTIDRVQPSCGCTTASLPPTPWTLHPGEGGPVGAKVSLAGKRGILTKTLTFFTSTGNRVLTLRVNVASTEATGPMNEDQRLAAISKAAGDAQAIFKDDCARCHVEHGRTAMGETLYAADCGICHESPRRASMVPDLHALKHETDYAFWKTTIALGKPRTLMPAFSAAHGGPLTDAQIESLATYLDKVISHHVGVAANAATGTE